MVGTAELDAITIPAGGLNPFEIRAWLARSTAPGALRPAMSLNPFEIRAWLALGARPERALIKVS